MAGVSQKPPNSAEPRADAGTGGDGLDSHALDALLGEQVKGCLDDRLLGLLAAGTAGLPSAAGGHPAFRTADVMIGEYTRCHTERWRCEAALPGTRCAGRRLRIRQFRS